MSSNLSTGHDVCWLGETWCSLHPCVFNCSTNGADKASSIQSFMGVVGPPLTTPPNTRYCLVILNMAASIHDLQYESMTWSMACPIYWTYLLSQSTASPPPTNQLSSCLHDVDQKMIIYGFLVYSNIPLNFPSFLGSCLIVWKIGLVML